MKINPSKSIRVINRLDSKPGTRKKYYTMERNERVDEFLTRHIKEATSQISSYDFRTYPNNNKIYDDIEQFLNKMDGNISSIIYFIIPYYIFYGLVIFLCYSF